MATKHIDTNGLLYYSTLIRQALASKINTGDADKNVITGITLNGTTLSPVNKIVNIPLATTSAAGALSATEKTILNGIHNGSSSGFSSLSTKLSDGLYLDNNGGGIYVVANTGNYIHRISDAGVELFHWEDNEYVSSGNVGDIDITVGTDTITLTSQISATDWSEEDLPAATTTTAGLMTAGDKIKLNGITAGAQVNVIEGVKLDGAASNLTPSSKVVTIPNATTSSNGLMSSTDKSHLDEMYNDSIDYAYLSDIGVVNASTSSASPAKNDYWKDNNALKRYDGSSWETVVALKLVRVIGSGNSTEGIYLYIPSVGFTEIGTSSSVAEKVADVTVNGTSIVNSSTKVAALTVDTTATNGSGNPISSGAMYTALGLKASLASPVLTGTPKAPTATTGTSSTQIATTAFVQQELSAAVLGRFKFVNSLPATGETGYIYLVPHQHTLTGTTVNNVYTPDTSTDIKDEYIWDATNSRYELIGHTDIDLSNYWSKSELETATNAEVLAAWENSANA